MFFLLLMGFVLLRRRWRRLDDRDRDGRLG